MGTEMLQTRRSRRASVRRRRLFLASVVTALAALSYVPLAEAVEERSEVDHVFDAALSLSASCKSFSFDPIEDPGCPGGVHPPEGRFIWPRSVATDPHGDIYVVNGNESQGSRIHDIDIFDPSGQYLTEVPNKNAQLTAIDSTGHLYVFSSGELESKVVRYDPIVYNPAQGEIAYEPKPVLIDEEDAAFAGMAIDPTDDHLFLRDETVTVSEYEAAKEKGAPNKLLTESIGEGALKHGPLGNGVKIAVDGVHHRLYAVDAKSTSSGEVIVRAFDTRAPYKELNASSGFPAAPIEGSAVPPGKFLGNVSRIALAVDESSGNLFIADSPPANKIFELTETGEYVETIKNPPFDWAAIWFTVDNGSESPNKGFLFVPSGSGISSVGHIFAYGPPIPAPPLIESISVDGVTEGEAVLHATINPKAVATTYLFEYVTQQAFEEEGFAEATASGGASGGTIKVSNEGVKVSAPVAGLRPGTAYRFRVTAENECQPGGCAFEKQGSFSTFGASTQAGECENRALRVGLSAALPDCRAYELVTPADTGGFAPLAPLTSAGVGDFFGTPTVSGSGDSAAFVAKGGVIPGLEGTGSFEGDAYRSQRTADGWQTEGISPSGTQTSQIETGGLSPDLNYFAVNARPPGSLVVNGRNTSYIRYPDGSFHQTGKGSIGNEPGVDVQAITSGGSHVFFEEKGEIPPVQQLEPNAPPTGTKAVYDRTLDGGVHVVSLLPGDVTPSGGMAFVGASTNGAAIAFAPPTGGNAQALHYIRVNDEKTLEADFQVRSGEEVKCQTSAEQLAGSSITYEWLLDGATIGGANASSYTPEPGQVGSVLQCVLRAFNSEAGSIDASPPLTIGAAHQGGPAPRPLDGVPSLSASGEVLKCHPSAWTAAPTFSYQWYRNGLPIAGASVEEYELGAEDEPHSLLQCAVRAAADGTETLVFSGSREVEPPVEVPSAPAPSIEDKTNSKTAPVVGDQLLCKAGKGSPTFTYQWLRNGTPIALATNSEYTLAAGDEGKALQCEVRATEAGGVATSFSPALAINPLKAQELPSGALRIKGGLAVGNTVECETGSWQNSPTFTYQWLRNGSSIATSSTYTLTPADHETVIQCVLSATNAKGTVLAAAGGFANQKPQASVSTPALGKATFAGFSSTGRYVFFVEGGDIYRFDTESEATTRITETGDALPIIVPSEGTSAYFISSSAIAGSGQNPAGALPVPPAKGQGTLTSGSQEVTGFSVSEGAFAVGMSISGAGIPAKTTITAVDEGAQTLTISTQATASGAAKQLSAGAHNLYGWDGSSTHFVATVTQRDVEGELEPIEHTLTHGFEEWLVGVSAESKLGRVPVRSTPDGSALLFESNADLGGFKAGGKVQIYRYSGAEDKLSCLSCDRTQATPPTGDAHLLSDSAEDPLNNYSLVSNLSSDGKRAFFQTPERLVARDNDHLSDVYEWEAMGEGTCADAGGCLFLISSGQSAKPNYVYGVSESGDDVFILTPDLLLEEDSDETLSVYDARVGGGFPPPAGIAGECLGEACQPAAVAPNDATPASSTFKGTGNVSEGVTKPRCPKGRHLARKGGKPRCVAKHQKKHKRANANRRASR